MLKSSEIPADNKLAQILESAQKIFGHYGFSKTTMNDIARELGISKASLYYYFPDKEHLFKAVIEKEISLFESKMVKIIEARKSASNILIKYIAFRHDFFRNLINLGKLDCEVMEQVKPIIGDLIKRHHSIEISLIEKILAKGIEEGEFKCADKKKSAILFVNVLTGLRMVAMSQMGMMKFQEVDAEELGESIQSFAKIFIKGISSGTLKGEK